MQDRYDPKEAEPRISKFWEQAGIYAFDQNSGSEVYAIDTPPPTISGTIGIHHFFSYSQADFIARYKRMRGYNVFYPFGLDNNGIPTELLVEKLHNTTAEREGREKFVALVEQETKNYEKMYREVFARMGISVDWSLLYTTINSDVQKASQLSFLKLNEMGREYRKETPTIWCVKERTALSQMELKDMVLKSKFVTLRFSDEVVIATTRPEMLPACVAIFVNPEDERNKKHIGKKVRVPIFGQEVSVLADKRVDPEKGTGIVMCCTFGDLTDIEWYKAYGLQLRIIIDDRGRMLGEYFNGLTIRQAREKIIADLKEKGYLIEEKEIEHTVNVHERCNTEIEFLVKKQWYIRYLDMKEKLLELGNKLEWHPQYMKVRYENWVNGLQWDWSISRQRYYGVPFPVWYCKKCDEPVFADEGKLPVNPINDRPGKACSKCGSNEMVPETDILDTWATSSLTPLINGRWGEGGELMKKIYPMDLRPQAHDIISFWLFTTVVKCYLHTGKLPWKSAMISGHALDPKGRAMHKSLGNVIDPLLYIEKYGSDALKHWASLSKLGDDSSFQEKDVMTGARMANKMWNMAKFSRNNLDYDEAEAGNVMDKWVLAKAAFAVRDATRNLDEYNYAAAKRVADELFWAVADDYLEFIKHRIYKKERSANYALSEAFLTVIKLLAPFMPYVTEDVYQNLYAQKEKKKSIHVSGWPSISQKFASQENLEKGERIRKVIVYIRQWKHNNKMALNAPLESITIEGDLDEGIEDIKGTMSVKEVRKGKGIAEIPETGLKISIERGAEAL
ncbi:MAG: valine--tRNA ligase [Candidatus Marsarchaeota archaeon]|jgi:valyl-tRNA synthetase|nr:valine--tRNA ligase [Candidatus Marsarchaeota archaeon]